MGRRQPQVKWKKRRLRQQTGRHQRGRDETDGLGTDAFGQQGDVERSVSTIQQHRAEHVEHRAEEGEQQVAQCGLQGLGTAFETDQRHAGEGQEFECDIQRKQIAGQKHRIERPPDRQQQRPEHERRTRLRHIFRGIELLAREERDAQHNHRRRQQHDRRQAVGTQGNAKRRRPATEQINQGTVRLNQFDANHDSEYEPGRNCQHGHAPGIAPTQGQCGENTDKRQDEHQDEEISACCRCLRSECR